MRRISASLLILFAGSFTFAQAPDHSLSNSASAQRQVLEMHIVPSATGCPVGFFASRRATGQIMSTADARQEGPAQGLHLMLNHSSSTPGIQSIEVTVYGTSQKARVLPVGQPSTDTVSKTFAFHRKTDSDSLHEADVWMHQVGSLRWADLISITYADGTTWHAAENITCRAVPSNFLLVANR
jgi:hypothetical protein